MTSPTSPLLEVDALEVIKRLSVRIGELEQQAAVAAIQIERLLKALDGSVERDVDPPRP